MQYVLEFILIFTVFLSIIPVINMFRNREDIKYKCLKYLIYSSFFWSVLILIQRVSTNILFVYYANMLSFPLKLAFASLMLCTIFQYVEKKLPKAVIYFLGGLVFIDMVIALSNSQTFWFLELRSADLSGFNDLFLANNGSLFIFHLIASYAIALTAIGLLFIFLAKRKEVRQYKAVSRMMSISVVVVLLFNLLQLFVVSVNIDLTYVSLVFVAYMLYEVIYRKDMVFNLRTSGRGEILSNMREMYILTDQSRRIVEISPLLLSKYNLTNENVIGKDFDELLTALSNQVVLYSEHHVTEETDASKEHYHLREKEFKLKGMNDFGYMILLYDETQVYKLLRDLNRLGNFDSMTGLNNRNYIEQKLYNTKDTKNTGVISLDLNGLKINNDYLGHERGDYLLKTLANNMKAVFKDNHNKDMARIGGDEFIVILQNTSSAYLEECKQQILDLCFKPEIDQFVSVAIGIAFCEKAETNIFQLIQQADAQMYEMKANTSKQYKRDIIEYIKLQDKYIR